jgi:hypothetical protein
MENHDWTQGRIALLEPPENWQPNGRIAMARLNGRLAERAEMRRRVVRWAIVIAVLAGLGGLLLPTVPRAIAQSGDATGWFGMERIASFWDYFTVMHLHTPTIVNPRSLPESVRELENRVFAKMSLREPAAAPSGARAPHLGVIGTPRFYSIAPVAMDSKVATGGVGKADHRDWAIRLRTGTISVAQWDAASLHGIDWVSVMLAQGPEPEIGGSDVQAFTTEVVRSYRAARGGHSPQFQIHSRDTLMHLPALAPAIVLGCGADARLLVSDAYLKAAPAVVVQFLPQPGDDEIRSLAPMKIERFALLWLSSGRIFLLTAVPATPPLPMRLEAAQSVESLIEIANSIE